MSKTLLLADDSVTIQKVVGISFASEDVDLVTVDNGDDAVSKAREIRPDVILADVVMPGKNGYEVCEAIKADPDLQDVPVLLLSGTFEAFDAERAENVGASGHISKPFEAQTLVGEVMQLMSAGPAARPATPVAEPVAEAKSSDDAFDFFDDEATPVTDAEPLLAEPVEPLLTDSAEPLDIGAPDDAFAFAENAGSTTDSDIMDELNSRPPAAAERTVAMIPDADDLPMGEPLEDPDLGFDAPGVDSGADDIEPLLIDDTRPDSLGPIGTPAEDAFDFDLSEGPAGDDSSLRVDTDDVVQATVLDPVAGSGYDVSTSDLDAPLASETPEPIPPETDVQLAQPVPSLDAEPIPEPEIPPAPVAPLAMEPTDDLPAVEAEPLPDVGPALEEIAPQLREQLHDTLEKIAWESFSDVTERIVQQALERVEAVAWEVIPQLAEALVREEIRRMKGEGDE